LLALTGQRDTQPGGSRAARSKPQRPTGQGPAHRSSSRLADRGRDHAIARQRLPGGDQSRQGLLPGQGPGNSRRDLRLL